MSEGRVTHKPSRGRRAQILHNLLEDDGSVAVRWALEDGEGWRHGGIG